MSESVGGEGGGGQGQGEEWDVDEVRGDHESDEHWELRKNFLLKNKGSYPKLRLLSLSQVFANHEFLGCRYPEETMDLVAELSSGIVEEYRQARAGRLQRTFVKASDAAERKSKGQSRKRMSPSAPPNVNKSIHHHLHQPPKVFVREAGGVVTPAPTSCGPGGSTGQSPLGSGGSSTKEEEWEKALSQFGDDLRGLVIVDHIQNIEGPIQTINRSCGMSHKPFSVDYDLSPPPSASNCGGSVLCSIRIGSVFRIEGRGFNKDTARQETATRTLEALRRLCYTIQVKASVVSTSEFGKSDIDGGGGGMGGVDGGGSMNYNPLTEDNVGSRLLRLMGWEKGQGLGKEGQGIQTPVSTSSEVVGRSRLGLGMEGGSHRSFGEGVKQFFLRQMWQCAQFDLQFTPEFSPDERKIIHQIASQFGLRSRSHGKGGSRFLVVSRKVELPQLVEELLRLGESAKYRVIPPTILMTSDDPDYPHHHNPPSDPSTILS